jgi:tRNA threonylcarbamoyladenosine biosynthesis protein TsaB
MLDARRMEVYSAMFTPNLENLRETLAEVITEHSFENFDEKLYFVGDCADKCKSTLSKFYISRRYQISICRSNECAEL